MKIPARLLDLGLTQYEITAYLALLGRNPLNGSRLSRKSGIPRARIYDVLDSLSAKGLVIDLGGGRYVPLPPEELIKRLRNSFESSLGLLEEKIKEASLDASHELVWTIRGREEVLAKARDMIGSAGAEIYTRLFPQEGAALAQDLTRAESAGIQVKYIAMGPPEGSFEFQVIHPGATTIEKSLGGRTFDLVVDREEILVGMFENGREDESPINWARNHWFVTATRDSLRHDFFHYFLHKLHQEKKPLSAREQRLYEIISNDL